MDPFSPSVSLCLSLSLSLSLSLFLSLSASVSLPLCLVSLSIPLCLCVSFSISLHLCLFVWSPCLSPFVSLCQFLSIFVSLSNLSVSLRLCLCSRALTHRNRKLFLQASSESSGSLPVGSRDAAERDTPAGAARALAARVWRHLPHQPGGHPRCRGEHLPHLSLCELEHCASGSFPETQDVGTWF